MVPPAVVRSNDLPRPILFFVAAKENGSACSSRSSDEVRVCSILRCREEERFRLQTATKQRLHRFLNSSSDLGIDAGFSPETPSSVHRFLISRPDLRIDAGFSTETPSSVHRFLISRPDLRIAAAPSLLQLKKARLQRSRGVPAGTGCHEGGIILSKKPPEWRLSPPESTVPPHNTETLTPQLHPQQDLFKLLRPKSCSRIVSER